MAYEESNLVARVAHHLRTLEVKFRIKLPPRVWGRGGLDPIAVADVGESLARAQNVGNVSIRQALWGHFMARVWRNTHIRTVRSSLRLEPPPDTCQLLK
eukprot:7316603-Prymnesium_polylepis.2